MTKIYIVRDDDHDATIYAIFSTPEKAQEYIDHQSLFPELYKHYEIEAHSLDPPLRPWTLYLVELTKTGELITAKREQEGGNIRQGLGLRGEWVRFLIKTDDREEAIRIADEKRRALIENNQWIVPEDLR
jgi:hypothetical protein